MNVENQHQLVAKRQSYFATLAHKEGQYNLQQARRNQRKGNRVIARDQFREAKICFKFEKMRRRTAKKNRSK